MNRKDIVQALLKTKTLEVVVMGDSMYPVIHQQDVAIVEAVGEYDVGDIIVYQSAFMVVFLNTNSTQNPTGRKDII